MNGLKEFGDFEIITWELKTSNSGIFNRIKRIAEFGFAFLKIKKIIQLQKPDMIIAERTTSYGFLAALSGVKPVAIAQQGRTDLWPEKSILLPLKKIIPRILFHVIASPKNTNATKTVITNEILNNKLVVATPKIVVAFPVILKTI